jgi:hypothetical protein
MILELLIKEFIVLSLFFVFIFPWLIHIIVTISNNTPYGWSNYNTFVKEFDKYNWDNEKWHAHSLWDRKNACQLHAGLITFNGKGMILKTPIDYTKKILFVRKYFKKNNIGNNKVRWE